jgi:mRNA interferase MazF
MAKSVLVTRSATSSANASYCPDANDIIWIDFNPQAGREQANRRPALVLSGRSYNQASGLCVLCPITSQDKGYPFEVALPQGAAASGVILSDQVKSLSWDAQRAAYIGTAPAQVALEARAKIKALLAIV